MKTPEQIIEEAIEILGQGWCQGALYKGPGVQTAEADEYCMIGALRRAAFGNNWNRREDHLPNYSSYRKAKEMVQGQIPICDCGCSSAYIPSFNDDPNTTVEDVRLVMKKAIASD